MFFGWAVVIVGVLFLLENLGLISIGVWNIIWPCLVILLGLSIVYRRERKQDRWQRFEEGIHRASRKIQDRWEKEGKD